MSYLQFEWNYMPVSYAYLATLIFTYLAVSHAVPAEATSNMPT